MKTYRCAVLDIASFEDDTDDGANSKPVQRQLLRILQEKLKFRCLLVETKDKLWGSVGRDGNWTGVFGLLQRSEADFTSEAIIATYERSKIADFSTPYRVSPYIFSVRKPKIMSKEFVYVFPFQPEVWLAIFVSLWVCSAVSLFLKHNFENMKLRNKVFLYLNELFNHFAAYLNQGEDYECPNRCSSYVYLPFWLLMKCVLVFGYSGVLLSILTLPSTAPAIDTLEKLRNIVITGKHKLVAISNSSDLSIFMKAESGYLKDIGDTMRNDPNHGIGSNGRHEHVLKPRTSVLMPLVTFEILQNMDENVENYFMASKEGLFEVLTPLGFRKGFPEKEKFNMMINRINAAGIYYNLRGRHLFKLRLRRGNNLQPKNETWETQNDNINELQLIHPISMHDLHEVFRLYAVCIVISIVALAIEIIRKARTCSNKSHLSN